MTDSTKAGLRCQICGETRPEPASLCLSQYSDVVIAGQPCEYSVEGQERTAAALNARARASGIPVQGGEEP